MRKIHLAYSDASIYLKRFEKNKRFGVLVAMGSKTYYFSNRQKCERFLNQFSNFVTETYKYFLQLYADINSSFTALFPYTPEHITFKIKEIFRMILDVYDMAFTDSNIRDNTVLINWLFWLESKLLKVCGMLKNIARKSRNQSEFTRIQNIKQSVKLQSDSFYNRFKKYEYKQKISSADLDVITLYNPLQLAINF